MFRSSDFHRLPMHVILGWPVTILVLIGIAAIVSVIGAIVWWVVSHLQWVG